MKLSVSLFLLASGTLHPAFMVQAACPGCANPKTKLNATEITQFVEDLVIPPVLYQANEYDDEFIISMRQFDQQVLPTGFPTTTQWGYGNPHDDSTFNNPAFTVEVTQNVPVTITWCNELVEDPNTCNCHPENEAACKALKHIVQDGCNKTLVDPTLHWASPDRQCPGPKFIDCTGNTADEYTGPIPMVTHVHGGHTEPDYDGYPESWYLPHVSDDLTGYALQGTYYKSRKQNLPRCVKTPPKGKFTKAPKAALGDGNKSPKASKNDVRKLSYGNQGEVDQQCSNYASNGCATFYYKNDQPTATLWFHDHTLGITRLNVYAAGAGFWILRKPDEPSGESGFMTGAQVSLPGPPVEKGEDPNTNPNTNAIRDKIREIPIAIQDRSFFSDGQPFYPANRAFFEEDCDPNQGDCEGICRADNSGIGEGTTLDLSEDNFLPGPNATDRVAPVWNPEAFFDTITVNGRTWPFLKVAPERYRFRLLDACDSRFLSLFLKVCTVGADCDTVCDTTGTVTTINNLPMYVIGSDQALLPQVGKVEQGSYSAMANTCNPAVTGNLTSDVEGLNMGPGERYDVIVDFAEVRGRSVMLCNSAPDSPFGGFPISPDEAPNRDTTAKIMRFDVKDIEGDDQSSTIQEINDALECEKEGMPAAGGEAFYNDTQVTGTQQNNTLVEEALENGLPDIPKAALLGDEDGKFLFWANPISNVLEYNKVLNWILENQSADAHPVHIHLFKFQVLQALTDRILYPWEMGWKDTVIALPNGSMDEVTAIRALPDIKGLYVWHCHILSHEDNEMMLPFCSGICGIDCPAELCEGYCKTHDSP